MQRTSKKRKKVHRKELPRLFENGHFKEPTFENSSFRKSKKLHYCRKNVRILLKKTYSTNRQQPNSPTSPRPNLFLTPTSRFKLEILLLGLFTLQI